MDDLISKRALLEKARGVTIGNGDEAVYYYGISAYDVKTAPVVDAVEVVRCKDCKRFRACEEIEGVSWTGWCMYGQFHTDEDDFCSRGERKENG